MLPAFAPVRKDKVYPALTFRPDTHFDVLMHEFHPDGRVKLSNRYGDEMWLDLARMGNTEAVQLFTDGDTISYRLYRDVPDNPPDLWVHFDFATRADRVKVSIKGKLPSPTGIAMALASTKQLRQTGRRIWAGEIDWEGRELHSVGFDWEDAPSGQVDAGKVSWDVGQEFELDPSTVSTSTSNLSVRFPHQHKAFYAAGRVWVFYSDGTDGVYRTSTNLESWSSAATFRSGITDGAEFSMWFDGTYLHYAYAKWNTANTPIYYRRGTPNSDGTITWSADEQTARPAVSGVWWFGPHVGVDTSGYAWVFYQYRVYGTATNYPEVTRSGNNDGTWGTTPGGFPYRLNTSSVEYWSGQVVPLTSGKMLAVYCARGTVRARRWDGSAWGSEVATSAVANEGYRTAAVADGDDAHIAFVYGAYPGPYGLRYARYTYSTNSWGSETILLSDQDIREYAPAISKAGVNLYVFWSQKPTAGHIYYRKWNGSSWETQVDWIDESSDGLTGGDNFTGFLSDMYQAVLYMTKTSSPYNIRIAFREFVVAKPRSWGVIMG
jgi:hypothetical protein